MNAMKYNFDETINRWGTDSTKYDGPKKEIGHSNYIPMWVADMDFKTPKPIRESIQKMLDNQVLGYTMPNEEWHLAIQNWVKTRYQLDIKEEELIFTPGIVRGIAFAVRCFTQVDDKILIMSPVYPPFFHIPEANKRKIVSHPLVLKDGQYHIDFDQFEKDVKGCKLFILCNPHNPGGRVWTREELKKIATICHANGTLVISDEIHADLTLPPHKHLAFSSVSTEAHENSILFMSPSKAFNMAGLASSYCIIHNDTLRSKYKEYVEALDVTTSHMFAYAPVVAAYTQCPDWLPQVLDYLQENIDYVNQTLKTKMPKIKMIKPQASFLIFLDCRELGLTDENLEKFFIAKANLLLNPGISFGKEGSGFMRLNIGCTKKTLQKAMDMLQKAYETLNQ